jgi:hypothetical protein
MRMAAAQPSSISSRAHMPARLESWIRFVAHADLISDIA